MPELGSRGLEGILTDGAVLLHLQPVESLSENDDVDDYNIKNLPRVCHEGIFIMGHVTSAVTVDTRRG